MGCSRNFQPNAVPSRELAGAVAEIRLHGERRVFVAVAVGIDGGLVHAIGRWRTRSGANYAEVRWSDDRAYSWPFREVRRITWLDPAALDLDAEKVGA